MNSYNDFSNVVQKGELILFRTIWNTSKDNMFIVRKDGNRFISERMNKSLRNTFNLTEEESTETYLDEFLDDEMNKKISQRYDICIEKNEIMSYEETYILNDSKPRYWDTTIIPVIDKEENITRIFGISKEITQFKRINETLEEEVRKRTKELEIALEKLKKVSVTDKLTGIYNRHHLDFLLEDTTKIINRYNNNYGVIILDLDRFKDINDTYGHHAGDIVLKEFSQLLKNSIRETDVLGRWGGDEFLILVPFATEESIQIFGNQIKNRIETFKFSYIDKLTTSIGITIIHKNDTTDSFIARADQALYKAKDNGKNQVGFI